MVFRRQGWVGLFWLALGLVVAFLLRFLFVEYEAAIRGLSPGCFFHRLTGWHCPGCGGTRAFFAFLKGDLALSWRMNPLFLLSLAFGAFFFLLALLDRRPQGRPKALAWIRMTPALGWLIVGLIVIFGILRNLPFAPFTSLAPL